MAKITPADEKTDLRRGVDHIGIGAGGVVHDGKGKILLMKRGPKARDENGNWDLCIGAIEFGESIDEAIMREVKEELCTEPIEIDFLIAYDAHRVHNGNKTHWIALVHAIKVDPTKVKIGEPHKIAKIGWFTKDNLPSPLHSMLHKALPAAIESGIVK